MAREGKAPAWPCYANDELSDEELRLAGADAVGAYFMLRNVAWRDGSIPADQGKLARLVRLSPARWARIWPVIYGRFAAAEGDPLKLVHPELEQERARMAAHREQQRNRAKSRWGSHAAALPDGVPDGNGANAADHAEPMQGPQSLSFASASASAPAEDRTDKPPHAREGGDQGDPAPPRTELLTRGQVSEAWTAGCGVIATSGYQLGELRDALVAVLEGLGTRAPEPVEYAHTACRAFKALREAWGRCGYLMTLAPAKMVEHLGTVQEIVAGDRDVSEIKPPNARPGAARGGGGGGGRQRVPVARNRGPQGGDQ